MMTKEISMFDPDSVRYAIQTAQGDAFSCDLKVYLSHLNKLVDIFDKSIIDDEALAIAYYEEMQEILQGIMLSFQKDFIPFGITENIISIVLPNWDKLTTQFFKEKQLDDTLIGILSLLNLKINFPNTNLEELLLKYNCIMSPMDYNALYKRAWYS